MTVNTPVLSACRLRVKLEITPYGYPHLYGRLESIPSDYRADALIKLAHIAAEAGLKLSTELLVEAAPPNGGVEFNGPIVLQIDRRLGPRFHSSLISIFDGLNRTEVAYYLGALANSGAKLTGTPAVAFEERDLAQSKPVDSSTTQQSATSLRSIEEPVSRATSISEQVAAKNRANFRQLTD